MRAEGTENRRPVPRSHTPTASLNSFNATRCAEPSCPADCLPERLKKRLWRLRTTQRDLAVDDEERHAIHPMPLKQSLGLRDRLHPFATVQHFLGLVPVQPSVGNHVDKRL